MASRDSKGRMIFWKISYNKQLAKCSIFSRLLYTWLIPNADNLGRMEGEPEIIKGMLFPYDEKITVKMITESLIELHNAKSENENHGLIIWYEVNGNKYIQFPKFEAYQNLRKDRDYKSDYPDPPELTDVATTDNDADMTSHDASRQNMTSHDASRQNMISHDLSCVKGREGKEKGIYICKSFSPDKTCHAELVYMKPGEYEKLVQKYADKGGKPFVDKCIEKLDAYKGQSAKNRDKYSDDYRTILSWVADEVAKTWKPPDKPPEKPKGTNWRDSPIIRMGEEMKRKREMMAENDRASPL